MTAQDWFLIGIIAFCLICAGCAYALNWAGTTDENDMAHDWWRDAP